MATSRVVVSSLLPRSMALSAVVSSGEEEHPWEIPSASGGSRSPIQPSKSIPHVSLVSISLPTFPDEILEGKRVSSSNTSYVIPPSLV